MGDQVYKLYDCEIVSVEPTGVLLEKGWLPGTFVKYSNKPISEPKSLAFATVDICDGRNSFPGFLLTGPKHIRPVSKREHMWTDDVQQQDGGEHRQTYSVNNGGANFLSSSGELEVGGTKCVSMVIIPTGVHKFYVFEGNWETYEVNQPLFVSKNGKLTNVKDFLDSVWTGYIVAKKDIDREGKCLFITAGMTN